MYTLSSLSNTLMFIYIFISVVGTNLPFIWEAECQPSTRSLLASLEYIRAGINTNVKTGSNIIRHTTMKKWSTRLGLRYILCFINNIIYIYITIYNNIYIFYDIDILFLYYSTPYSILNIYINSHTNAHVSIVYIIQLCNYLTHNN